MLTILPLSAQSANKRLILKDGTYQIARRYEVVGDRVRFISAERGGDWEEIPSNLIDWVATEKWARDHAPGTAEKPSTAASPAAQAAREVDQEEQEEKALSNLRMPIVAPGLRLPDQDGVWALDTFHAVPELVRIQQYNADLNHTSSHNVLKSTINSLGGTKTQIMIEGARSKVRLHVNDPAIYVSLDTEDGEAPSEAMTVDTHGAGSDNRDKVQSSATSHYAIVHLQQKKDLRVVGAMSINTLGKVSQAQDVIDTNSETLPGKHWLKITPRQPLDIGEYALIEILSPKEVNLVVWDFSIDPTSPENLNARMPLEPAK